MIVAMLIAAAIHGTYARTPLSAYPASIAHLKMFLGTWKSEDFPFVKVHVSRIRTGRILSTLHINGWYATRWMPVVDKRGDLMLFAEGELNLRDRPSFVPSVPSSDACWTPARIVPSGRGLSLRALDIPATFHANGWLVGGKVDGEGCPLFLQNLSRADQARLNLAFTRRGMNFWKVPDARATSRHQHGVHRPVGQAGPV